MPNANVRDSAGWGTRAGGGDAGPESAGRAGADEAGGACKVARDTTRSSGPNVTATLPHIPTKRGPGSSRIQRQLELLKDNGRPDDDRVAAPEGVPGEVVVDPAP